MLNKFKNVLSTFLVLQVLLTFLLPLVTPSFSFEKGLFPETEPGIEFEPERIIVKMANTPQARAETPDLPLDFTEAKMLNPSLDIDNTDEFNTEEITETQNNTFVLTLSSDKSDDTTKKLKKAAKALSPIEEAIALLNADPAVEIAEPDYIMETSAILHAANDPQFNAQYALQKINAEAAWSITTGSKDIVVGIIDTGIDGTHPDLKDNLWVNPNPNLGGFENDIHGYNFAEKVGGTPTDKGGHGTHVAGIVGAVGNNNIGVCGINWNVSLAWLGASTSGTSINTSNAIEALNYANTHGIQITNNSYGGSGYSTIFEKAIADYNGIFVTSAGNGRGNNNDVVPHYPSDYNLPNVISVASTDHKDRLSDFSNYGVKNVHIAAPGSGVLSTHLNGTYRKMSGTSMASPYIAGVAALVLSENPHYTPEEMRELLCSTSRRLDQLTEFIYCGGVVDAYAALLNKKSTPLLPPSSPPPSAIVLTEDAPSANIFVDAGKSGRVPIVIKAESFNTKGFVYLMSSESATEGSQPVLYNENGARILFDNIAEHHFGGIIKVEAETTVYAGTYSNLPAEYIITAVYPYVPDRQKPPDNFKGVKGFSIPVAEPPAPDSTAIYDRAGLEGIKDNLNGRYHLAADIDLSGEQWIPIGGNENNSEYNEFTGVFDGRGHTIRNMTITGNCNRQYIGLFGRIIKGTIIKNLGMENTLIDISVEYPKLAYGSIVYVGAVCGYASADDDNDNDGIMFEGITNCYNTGYISAIAVFGKKERENKAIVGGICGYNGGVKISDCRNAGEVRTKLYFSDNTPVYVGGICGGSFPSTDSNAYGGIINCENFGDISSDSYYSDNVCSYVGGACGNNQSYAIKNFHNRGDISVYDMSSADANSAAGGVCGYDGGDISLCSNAGEITASAFAAGGICGNKAGGVITKCYNSATVSVTSLTSRSVHAGGICGAGEVYTMPDKTVNIPSITNCYNIGDINVYSDSDFYASVVGGIIGYLISDNKNGEGRIADCYNAGDLSVYCAYNTYNAGICGYNYGDYSIIENCYWNGDNLQTVNNNDQNPKKGVDMGNDTTTASDSVKMKQRNVFIGFDFDTIWGFENSNNGYPVLRDVYRERLYLRAVKFMGEDFIQIYNPSENIALSTRGLYLSDDEEQLFKRQLQTLIIRAGFSTLIAHNTTMGLPETLLISYADGVRRYTP